MSVLVIGGDRLGNIPTQLTGIGFTEIRHITGRKKGHLTMDIPYQVDVVLVLTDYINHGLALKIKEKTREMNVKTVFARRAWSHIASVLKSEMLLPSGRKGSSYSPG